MCSVSPASTIRPSTMCGFSARLAAVLACLSLLVASSASAATSTWLGATNVSWATTSNWNGGTVPGTGDTAVFASGTANGIGIDIGSGITLNQVLFSSAASGTFSINTGTGSITLNDGGTLRYDKVAAGTYNQTIARPLVLSGSATFTNNNNTGSGGGNTLTLSGSISGNGTITVTGSGTTSGGGTTISGVNSSFTGAWDVRSGYLIGASNSSALGASNATVALSGSGALLALGNGAHNVAITSNQAGGVRWNGGATWSGTLSMSSGITGLFSTGGNAVTWSGVIAGDSTAGVSSTGNNPALTLSGTASNTLSGAYTFGGGAAGFVLNKTNGAAAVSGNLVVAPWNSGTTTVSWSQPNQITDASIVTVSGTSPTSTGIALLQLKGNSDIIGGLVSTGSVTGFVQNQTASSTSTLTMSVASGTSYTFAGILRDGTSTTPGVLAIGMAGSGTQVFSGSNTFSGGAAINGGVLRLGHANALGTGTATVSVGTLDLSGLSTVANSVVLSGGTLANGTVNVSQLTANSGVISASIVGAAFTKATGGKLTLSGSNSYTGSTTITGGTLAIGAGGSIASSSSIIVGNAGSSGAVLDVLAKSGGLALGAAQTISGSGVILGDMTIAGGATLAPGNSPGTLHQTGAVTWAGGGNYNWQIYDTASGAGAGWDFFDVTGALAITATSGTAFNINVWSLSGLPDTSGAVANFDPAQSYSWTIATFSGGITGFDAGAFSLNLAAINGTGGFANPYSGNFSVAQSPDLKSIQIVYVVPEPGTLVLAGLGLAAAGWSVAQRRRRR